MGILAEPQIRFYYQHGFIVVPGLVSPEECVKIVKICKSKANKDFKGETNLDRSDPDLNNFVRNPAIEKVVRELHFGMPMDYLSTQVLFKQPGTPFSRHAWNLHQDNHYTKHPWGMGVSAIIALEDSSPENGGMFIYPGSHFEPILHHEPHTSYNPNENPGNRCELPEKYINNKYDLRLSQGDLYIQHGNLIHGSYPNTSQDRSRTHFGIACIVRGQPFSTEGKSSNRMPRPLTPLENGEDKQCVN